MLLAVPFYMNTGISAVLEEITEKVLVKRI
jgi:hypothetical protein